ncbi:MAG: HAMP domain-containing histidine kinase [Chitinophagaceae bacterium]|nr:MAG: HAMP domain-containing histidine kinase [Chitinophagaceae bacterium]
MAGNRQKILFPEFGHPALSNVFECNQYPTLIGSSEKLDPGLRNILSDHLMEVVGLQDMVAQFLVLSQLKADTLKIEHRPVELSKLVLTAFNRVVPLLDKKSLVPKVVFADNAGDLFVNGDEEMLRLVLSNVVENAAKYSTAGSEVSLAVQVDDANELALVELRNSIPVESIDTSLIRAAFVRAASSEGGTGLGLRLCDQIVAMHGGKLELESSLHWFILRITLPLHRTGS